MCKKKKKKKKNLFECVLCAVGTGLIKKIKMKTYLTSLSFYLFLYIYVSDFFFSGVVFPRLLISFFLGTSSNCFLFSGFFSLLVNKQKNIHAFLIFFWQHFKLHIQIGQGKTVYFVSQILLLVMGSLSQLTCLIFALCRFYHLAALYHVDFLANQQSTFK